MDQTYANDLFDDDDELIEITVVGQQLQVPSNNSILRCLQFLWLEGISYGDFCWNGDCLNCQVWITAGDREKAVIACRTNVVQGMEIVRFSEQIRVACDVDPAD